MAIASNNTIQTNYQTEIVALRAAEVASYFTLGSKAYIPSSELANKSRNGQTYGFVIRDRGEVENQLAVSAGAKKNIVERKVELSIEPWHVYESNNVVEGKTDMDWDLQVAQMDGPALIQGAVKKSINRDVPKCSTAFVGDIGSFEPLSMATGHLSSVTSEPLYGFVDPMIEAVVTSKGAQFVPVDAPAMYKQGLIGHFHGADYRSQRFLKKVVVPAALGTAMSGAVFGGFDAATNTLTVTFGANAASAFTVKAGTPFFVDGVVACDTLGDETAEPYAFIANADVSVTQGASSVDITVDEVPVALGGTRVAALEDGTAIKWTGGSANVTASNAVTCPAAGTYFLGIIRANGAYNFQTLDDIDVATVESKKGSVQGITVFQNRLTDLDEFTTGTRFDTFTLAGTVEKRCQALVLIKAK